LIARQQLLEQMKPPELREIDAVVRQRWEARGDAASVEPPRWFWEDTYYPVAFELYGQAKMAATLVHAHCGASAVVHLAAANKAVDDLILRVLEKATVLEEHPSRYRPKWGSVSMVGRGGEDIDPAVVSHDWRALIRAAGAGSNYLKKAVRQKQRSFLQQNCMVHGGTCSTFAEVPVGEGVGLLNPAHGCALVVVDEAGQVTEPAAYVAFLADARCTVLIGDPAQSSFGQE